MKLTTERLILRNWQESDAENLYKYAKDPDIGPIAGWPPHQNVDESEHIIKNVLCSSEAYALCLKSNDEAIGSIELKLYGHTDLATNSKECELRILDWQTVLGARACAGSSKRNSKACF